MHRLYFCSNVNTFTLLHSPCPYSLYPLSLSLSLPLSLSILWKWGNGQYELVGKPKQFRFGFGRKFRPFSVSVFRFSPFLVLRPKYYFRPKQPFSAEIPCFGWFWPHIYVKSHLPKQPFLAKIRYFGRNRLFWPNMCIGRNFGFSRGPCFGFSVSAKNLFRLPTSMNDPDRPGARVNISTNCDAFLPVPHLDLVLDTTVLQIQRWNQWSAKHEMPNLHNDTRSEEGFCGRRSRQFTFYTNSVRLAQTRNRLRFHPPHAEVRSRPCMVERFRINDTKLR